MAGTQCLRRTFRSHGAEPELYNICVIRKDAYCESMEATLGRRERKKQATRQALRHAALRLALERGLDHFTVEEISERADVSPRTFFNYFSCKEDALVGESPEAEEELRQAITARPLGEPPLETLRAVLKEFGAAHTSPEYREDARLRQQLVTAHPSLLPRRLAHYTSLERVLTEELAARTGADPGRDLRPAVLAAVGVTVARLSLQRWTDGGSRPLSEFIDEAFDLLARGL